MEEALVDVLSEIFADSNIAKAIEHLKTKKNTCGDDSVWLHSLDEYWKWNGDAVVKDVRNGSYEPGLIHERMIITGNGKRRIISMMSSLDRLIVRAINQILQEKIDSIFSEYSYAYRNDKGAEAAALTALEYIEAGNQFVVEIDINNFFDNIKHSILLKELKKHITNQALFNLLEKYIVCRVEYDCEIHQKNVGLVQGNALSPLLSNIYLNMLDSWMEEQGYLFVRFADDIRVYTSGIQGGYEVLDEVSIKLRELGLEVSEAKKGVYNVFSRKCLGYEFVKCDNSVLLRRSRSKSKKVNPNWHKTAIEKVNQEYYIINDGILNKKDFSVLFENDEKKVHIPVEIVDSINVYSDVILNTNFLKLMMNKRINVNVFDNFGIYQGSFMVDRQRNRMKVLMRQVMIYANEKERLVYAKKINIASVHNMRCNLRYYKKQHRTEEIDKAIEYISEGIARMNESIDITQLLLEEGRCRQKYYHSFNEIVGNDEFAMTARSKRPPKDAINAMISFGNTYLYQKIARMIYRSQVDIRVSFVHSALKRCQNLNLDIADIFKPIVVDRVIFSMINKKMISSKLHFESYEDGVYLNKEGKRIFLYELNSKMQQKIKVGGNEYTYERLVFQEVKKIELDMLGENKYKAYKHRI